VGATLFAELMVESSRTLQLDLSLVTHHSSLAIFLVSDFFHPFDRLVVQRLLDGDVRHRSRRRSAVPMLFTRGIPTT
jgi:hypothetical protein